MGRKYGMLKLYLVRHGQTYWNANGMLQGHCNSNLTEEGIRQAKLLGEKLGDVDFEVIYSSDLGRAIETAEILKGLRNQEIVLEKSLREMGFGKVQGVYKDEFERNYPVQYRNLWNYPHLYDPSEFGGETFEEVEERAAAILEDIIERHSSGNVLLVSHGLCLKLIFKFIWDHSLEQFWKEPTPKNTSLSIISIEDGKMNVELFGDISHLDWVADSYI